jgi:hypothetical protein
MSVVLRHHQEGFAEELELRADSTFRYVCSYHVIYGGQYDEDDVTETYTGAVRRHRFGEVPHGVIVLVVGQADRKTSNNTFDLTRDPPELLAFLDRRGDLAELVHAAAPAYGVADERAFFAGQRVVDHDACRCKNRDEHALRR